MTRDELAQYAVEELGVEELKFFDPPEVFDHAIIGLVVGFGQEPAVLYDEALVLEAFAKDLGDEGAREWFDFNVIGAYIGPSTPRFLKLPLG